MGHLQKIKQTKQDKLVNGLNCFKYIFKRSSEVEGGQFSKVFSGTLFE